MSDIVERLRAHRIMCDGGNGNVYDIADDDCEEAADEIEQLRAQVERAKEVLKPFAMLADLDAKGLDGLTSVYPMVAAGRLQDARRLLDEICSTPLPSTDKKGEA